MCGINGVFAYGANACLVREEEVIASRDRLQHRGPDGAGAWFSPDQEVGLGHRRLSILDLSDAGTQPMTTPDERHVIVFNGEIYNFGDLRGELIREGCSFRSNTDTEVLLALFVREGAAMLERLRGMFAFAIWDQRERSLFLARDGYGIKPLYYQDDGCVFRFASQVRALCLEGTLESRVDPAAVAAFLLLGSVPEPLTIDATIKALPAGSWMRVNGEGVQGPVQWWSVAAEWGRRRGDWLKGEDFSSGLEEVRDAVRDSVQHHLVSDVPVGVFLSAGIDSGALCGLLAEMAPNLPAAFTLAFEEFKGTDEDELPWAKALAAQYGCNHTTAVLKEGEFREQWETICRDMDQPSIDGVNNWFLARSARDAGCKVVLSGLGGDELFGGYPSFRDVPRWKSRFAWSDQWPQVGAFLRKCASSFGPRNWSPKGPALFQYAGSWEGAWFVRRGLFMPWELPAIMGREWAQQGWERLQLFDHIRSVLEPMPLDNFGKIAAMEASLYMRNQLLRDADWAGMAHGVEIRVPLVDQQLLHRLAPGVLKRSSNPRFGKEALASAPASPLPDAVMNRKKTGFTLPYRNWLQRIESMHVPAEIGNLFGPRTHWSRRMALGIGMEKIPGLRERIGG